jgi:predicted metal-dependent hydrolase
MPELIHLGELPVQVFRKKIKNLHLSVLPPNGRVRISAPETQSLERIKAYAVTKLPWIRQQQRKLRGQDRESIHRYAERESHYLWGRRYLLKLVETDGTPGIALKATSMNLRHRPGTSEQRRGEILEEWYRETLKAAVLPLLEKWEKRIGVQCSGFHVQRMRTKWGSCSHARKTIRLNSELARKPKPCLEYLIVHELIHLLEPTHNARFRALLDQHLPNWQNRKKTLNSLPVRHETWGY